MLSLPPFRSNTVQPHSPSDDTMSSISIPTVSSVASIFKFQKVKLSKSDAVPKLNESHPLSLYFFAEEHLSSAIKHLEKVKSVCSRRFHRYTERVHLSQKLLLDTIYLIYSGMDDTLKCPKPHRGHLPYEDQMELSQGFSENILFAAQAIVHGFHIRGIEHCSEELKEPALQLCATLEALRHVFRIRALERPEPPYLGLYPVLIDFDKAWTDFEKEICQSYFSAIQSQEEENRPNGFEEFSKALQATLIDSIDQNLMDKTLIEEFDPSIIFALPRLTFLNFFLQSDKSLLGIDNREECYLWFSSHHGLFKSLDFELSSLDSPQVQSLKQWLVNSAPPTELSSQDQLDLQPIFNQICMVADSLQSGTYSKQFLSSLNIAFTEVDASI